MINHTARPRRTKRVNNLKPPKAGHASLAIVHQDYNGDGLYRGERIVREPWTKVITVRDGDRVHVTGPGCMEPSLAVPHKGNIAPGEFVEFGKHGMSLEAFNEVIEDNHFSPGAWLQYFPDRYTRSRDIYAELLGSGGLASADEHVLAIATEGSGVVRFVSLSPTIASHGVSGVHVWPAPAIVTFGLNPTINVSIKVTKAPAEAIAVSGQAPNIYDRGSSGNAVRCMSDRALIRLDTNYLHSYVRTRPGVTQSYGQILRIEDGPVTWEGGGQFCRYLDDAGGGYAFRDGTIYGENLELEQDERPLPIRHFTTGLYGDEQGDEDRAGGVSLKHSTVIGSTCGVVARGSAHVAVEHCEFEEVAKPIVLETLNGHEPPATGINVDTIFADTDDLIHTDPKVTSL